MGLSIGQLNLQLVGNSKGLKKMLPDMNRLGKTIDKLGRSQEKGSAKSVSALNRQEQAIRRQLRAVKDLNAQIKRTGGPANLMGTNTQAMQAFTRAMSKGVVTTAEFNRQNDKLTATLGKSGRKLRAFNNSAKSDKIKGLSKTMQNLESASVLAIGPLSGLGARIRALGAIANRSAIKMALFFGAITAGIVAMGVMIKGSITAARSLEAIESRLVVVTGSTAQAAAHFKFVSDTAAAMGQNIMTAAVSYSQLAASTKNTAAEGRVTRTVFKGLIAAGAALRLSNEQLTGAFRAVQQIASKGRVQSEELIGQLAERIPNAIQLMAEAFETTQAGLLDMVQKGMVPASTALDKFGRKLEETFSEAASKNVTTLMGATNRLDNAFLKFNITFEKITGTSDAWAAALNAAATAVEAVTRNLRGTLIVLGALTAGFTIYFVGGALIKGVVALVKAFKMLRNMLLGTVAVTAALTGGVGMLLALAAGIAGAAAAAWTLDRALGSVNDDLEGISDNTNAVEISAKLAKSLSAIAGEVSKASVRLKGFKNGLNLQSDAAADLAEKYNVLRFFIKGTTEDTSKLSETMQAMIAQITKFDRLSLQLKGFEEAKKKAEDVAEALKDIRFKTSALAGDFKLTSTAALNMAKKFELGSFFLRDNAESASSLSISLQGLIKDIQALDQAESAFKIFEEQKKRFATLNTAITAVQGEISVMMGTVADTHKPVIKMAAGFGITVEALDKTSKAFAKLRPEQKALVDGLNLLEGALDTKDSLGAFNKRIEDASLALENMTAKVRIAVIDTELLDPATVALAAKMGMLQVMVSAATGATQTLSGAQRELLGILQKFEEVAAGNSALAKIKSLIESTENPTEKLARKIKEIAKLKAFVSDNAELFPDQTKTLEALDKVVDRLKTGVAMAFKFGDAFASAFEDAIIQGQGLRKILQGLLQDILKIILRTLITKPLGQAIGGLLGGIFKAHGGPVSGGRDYIVGEEGPEVFSPNRSGTITPNDQLQRVSSRRRGGQSGNVQITQHITFETTVKDDMRAMIIEAAPAIAQASAELVGDNVRRSGFSRSFGVR